MSDGKAVRRGATLNQGLGIRSTGRRTTTYRVVGGKTVKLSPKEIIAERRKKGIAIGFGIKVNQW